MPPLLSICIMSYNRAETLREALDSLLRQADEHPEVEVMVSDNASTDNTGEVVAGYREAHPSLRYSRNPENLGFDGNVVACLENAAGEYVAYFSDDDIAPAGYVSGLARDLIETRPVALYINHAPFFENNPANLGAPTQPVLKRTFNDPAEYFLFTGLGFISALVLKREEALKYKSSIVENRGTAQVDIAARTVLSSAGPFLFDGTINILARFAYDSGYDPLRYGSINTTLVHRELLSEGLLKPADVAWHDRKTIRLFLPRHIVNNRIKKREKTVTRQELQNLYGADPLFYLYAWPLLIVPAAMLRAIAIPARAIMRLRRRLLAGRQTSAG